MEETRPLSCNILHDEVRFAEGGAAGRRGSDARRDRRIEEVDVEADMQAAICRRDPFEKTPYQRADAVLVESAHVVNGDAGAC